MIEETFDQQPVAPKAPTSFLAKLDHGIAGSPIGLAGLRRSGLLTQDGCFGIDRLPMPDVISRSLGALLSTKIEAGNIFSTGCVPKTCQLHTIPDSSLSQPEIPAQINRYGLPTLESKFDVVGSVDTRKMCQIFYCTTRVSDPTAVKELFVAKVISNKQSSRKALQEAQVMKLLNATQELVPELVDCWTESKKTVIVMKRCHSDLENQLVLDRDTISIPISRFKETLRMLADVASTLLRLNNLGYAHLDLKPENIFVNSQVQPRNFQFASEATSESDSTVEARNTWPSDRAEGEKCASEGVSRRIDQSHRAYLLGDFGLAESNRHACKFGVVTGDHTYMPLETLDLGADTRMDLHKVDMFSLGLVAFRMVTNLSLPTNGSDWEQLRTKTEVVSEGLDRVNCPEWLSSLIKKCLSKEPEARPTAAEVLESIGQLTKGLLAVQL